MRTSTLSIQRLTTLLFTATALLVTSLALEAAPPTTMNYQGRLASSDGTPVNGVVNMLFRIYETPTAGTALWEETQSVSLLNGYFNIELGVTNPLTSSAFINPTFLGVTVGADSEMTPRARLSSVPYAFRAQDSASAGSTLQVTPYRIYGVTNAYCGGGPNALPTFQPTCTTAAAGACATYTCPDGAFKTKQCPRYYACDGTCLPKGELPQTCANSIIGVIVNQ